MKTRWILATLVLGLGVAMALLWLLGGGMSNVARAQGSDGHDTYYVDPGAEVIRHLYYKIMKSCPRVGPS